MAASPIAAALAVALTLALPPGALVHVPTDRSITTIAPEIAPADAPPPEGPAPGPTALPPAAESVVVVTTAPIRAEGPARAPAIDLGCHGSGPCQRLIALGSVAGGLGLAALAVGAALLIRPAVVDPRDPTTILTYRPVGAALLAVGSGLAATWLLTLLAARKAGRLAQRRHLTAAVP